MKMKMFARPTHCQYLGCTRALPQHAVKGIDNRWYCDNPCARSGERYMRDRQQDDRKIQHLRMLGRTW